MCIVLEECKKTVYLLMKGGCWPGLLRALHCEGVTEWRGRSQRDRLNREVEAGGIVEDDWESQ
jgi:hypothetical protein